MDTDGAIRNIEKEILRECHMRSIDINRNFLNYFIKLLTLNPEWGISVSLMTNRYDVQKFIKHVVHMLEHQRTPEMVTLKMQYYFQCNFAQRFKVAKANRTELASKLNTLENEIIETRTAKSSEEIELMFKKMVFYISATSGMGNPLIEPVYREVRTALGSIITDEHEMRHFVEMARYLKEEQLAEYVKLVTGVRIFNKDCDKGGEGMEDLPKLIKEALIILNDKLKAALLQTMEKVNLYTTAFDCAVLVQLNERGNYCVSYNVPADLTIEDIDSIKKLLIVYRQIEVYIRNLMNDLDKQRFSTDGICEKLKTCLVDLHTVVMHRIAIPIEEVFPLFSKLSEIWCLLQDQSIFIAKITIIMNNLMAFSKGLNYFDDNIALALIPAKKASMSDVERLSVSSKQKSTTETLITTSLCVSISKEVVALDCLGFCPWTLTESKGGLLPGNSSFGVCSVLNMHFVFASVAAGVAFTKYPEKSVMNLLTFVRKRPELIHLLNLQEAIEVVQSIVELVREPPLKPLTTEIDIQTEVHPVDSNIDKNYYWNVWDLKRNAIKLANLTHCLTTSAQTLRSTHRLSIGTQTFDKKQQCTQTKTDNYTNVPTPSNFIYGLRGRKDDKQVVIELTRPVKE